MRKIKKILSIILLTLILISNSAFAMEIKDYVTKVEYSERFKEWEKLPDLVKERVIEPRTFDIPDTYYKSDNPINIGTNVGATLEGRYSLEDHIKNNVAVKNQMKTNSCWTFASLGTLETNLALSNPSRVYDFSERHMEYATTRVFKNNQINQDGLNRKPGDGGNVNVSRAYLTNGQGAILEEDMPFENNEDLIDISEIQNKRVASRVLDTIDFASSYPKNNLEEFKNNMKSYIKSYGGIEAGIHGASILSDYYNNDTGAIYCDNKSKCPIDHDVLIIGWDDAYSRTNFQEACRPQNDGAWIIRNSWGTKVEYTLEEMKKEIFKHLEAECREKGWQSYSQIPDDVTISTCQAAGYRMENDKVVLDVGDKGKMYVSYEDVNVYTSLYGIQSATSDVDYDNIYQYDFFGATTLLAFKTNVAYISNVFEKKTNDTEYLTSVSLYAPETYKCTVYVNPNGSSRAMKDLVQVNLTTGSQASFGAGYHTMIFSNPVELNSREYTVVVKVEGTRSDGVNVGMETPVSGTAFDVVKLESGKCYWTVEDGFEENTWIDFSELKELSGGELANSDSTIKAFTKSTAKANNLESIEIQNPPSRVVYTAGEDFNRAEMKVIAKFTDGSSREVTDYSIENGNNLREGQTEVIIVYQSKRVAQKITVQKASGSEEEVKAQNSDISDLSCKVLDAKAFLYVKYNQKEYMTFKVQISGIKKSNVNDNLIYYYYLSPTSNTSNIINWVPTKATVSSSGNLEFVINTTDVSNYDELTKSDKLFLYIKEVAINGKDQKEAVSNPMQVLASSMQVYVDGKLQTTLDNNGNNNNGNNNNGNANNNNNNANSNNPTYEKKEQSSQEGNVDNKQSSTSADETTAQSVLPKTGLAISLIVLMLSVCAYGIITYIKYRKLGF